MARDSDFEICVREAWNVLVQETLPRAAGRRAWPIASSAGFVRLLLDQLCGGPWEETADRTGIGTVELILAIEAGERILSGHCDIGEMNRRSLAARAAPLDDGAVARLLVENGAEADAMAAEAGLSAGDLISRICVEAARRRRKGRS